MSNRATHVLFLMVLAAAIIAGAAVYSSLPDRIAAHWNVSGAVDGTLPRFWGVALFPVLLALVYGIYAMIPRIDPLRRNIEAFRPTFNVTFVAIALFMVFIFALVLGANLGLEVDMTLFVLPAVAVLFYFLGLVLPKAKRNWFFGIRTPWTMSSDEVWAETHRFAGLLFQATALASLVALIYLRGTAALIVVLVGAVGTALASIVYSYFSYRRHNAEKGV